MSVVPYPGFSTVRRSLRSIGSTVWRNIATATAGAKSYRGHRRRAADRAEPMVPLTDEIERNTERRIFDPGSRIRYWL
jgi:hypothetical protein